MLRPSTLTDLCRLLAFTLICSAALALSPSPSLAQVDGERHTPGNSCPSATPAGQSADWDTFFECNGSNQWQRAPYFFGASSDSCDSSHEGLTRYDSTAHALYYCNGAAWTQIEPVQSTPVETANPASGYIVMSGNTYDGNLGWTTGANALCLSDLTTNTGWQGYSTANSRGLLNSAHVFAFLCNESTCTSFSALTTYYFANAGNASAGGASFTTDANGNGPNDNADWSAANYFGGNYYYFANRDRNTSAQWASGLTQLP